MIDRLCGGILLLLTIFAGAGAHAGKSADTLVWATDRELAIIDPYFDNTREMTIIGHMVWDGLVYLDAGGTEVKPLLATAWKWVDNTTLEFDLKKGVKFHDGSDFDADDVVYTLNFISKKDNGIRNFNLVSYIKSAEKIESHKVRVTLNAPFPAALIYLANYGFILPSGNYDSAPARPDGKKDYGAVKPVGSGPFKVDSVKAGEFVAMSRNDTYVGSADKKKPAIGKLRFRTIKERNTQIAELLTGGVDWIWDVPKDQAERLEGNKGLVVKNEKTMRISFLTLDVTGTSATKAFADKRVRQALAHAINRESITKNLVGPASVVINTICHPDQFACPSDLKGYAYDPEKAKSLLKEANAEGVEFEFYAYREREFSEAVMGDLSKAGFKPKLNFLQFSAVLPLVHKGQTPIFHSTWGSNSIPDVTASTAHYFAGSPDDTAKDAQVIAQIKLADQTVDSKKRAEIYKGVHEKILGEAYAVPLFTYAKYYAYSKDLDFKPSTDELPRFFESKWK